jgi:hypothetical protein
VESVAKGGCSASAAVFCRFGRRDEMGFSVSGSGTGLASLGGGAAFRFRETDGACAGVAAAGDEDVAVPEVRSGAPACLAEALVILGGII